MTLPDLRPVAEAVVAFACIVVLGALGELLDWVGADGIIDIDPLELVLLATTTPTAVWAKANRASRKAQGRVWK